jgi:hypothetical protein
MADKIKTMNLLDSVETFVIFSNAIALHPLLTPNEGIYN